MQTFDSIIALRAELKKYREQGLTVGFVPTMGNLHEGHLCLTRAAREQADIVVVSIFVNPMQFDRVNDLDNYPRTLSADIDKLSHEGVEIVYTPTPEAMYLLGLDKQTFVEVPNLSYMLEGVSRPGHFRGVTTIVAKLFNIVQPNVAVFGEKDFQQLAVIRRMVNDMAMDIEIIGVATIREASGLAMSSRNNMLTNEEREVASQLAKTMHWIGEQLKNDNNQYDELLNQANSQLGDVGFKPDEIFIRDAKTLMEIDKDTEQVVILMSAFLGKARLIDNLVVSPGSVSSV